MKFIYAFGYRRAETIALGNSGTVGRPLPFGRLDSCQRSGYERHTFEHVFLTNEATELYAASANGLGGALLTFWQSQASRQKLALLAAQKLNLYLYQVREQ